MVKIGEKIMDEILLAIATMFVLFILMACWYLSNYSPPKYAVERKDLNEEIKI